MTRAPAIFASSFHPHVGGVEEAVRQLAAEQVRRGLTPVVFTNRYPKGLPTREMVEGVPVLRHAFRVPGAHWRHLAGWVAAGASTHRSVARDVRARRNDLVHVQCVSSNASYALTVRRGLALPFVVTMQGELTMDASDAYRRSAYLRHLWRRSLDAANVITACSQFVLDEAEAVYGGFGGRARVIPNGIRLADYTETRQRPWNSPYVLGIGRMVEVKGFDRLIKAFASLSSVWPELFLLLAGDGPARTDLEALVARLGLAPRVHFRGYVSHADAVALFQHAAVFVLPSRHEPQGIVVLEAMAAGTPVVAARVGGVPEIVQDRTNGLLYNSDDMDALGAAIHRTLADADLRGRLVISGRASAARHDWGAATDAYLAAYSDAAQ